MKSFLVRLSYYLIVFGFSFLIVLPLVGPFGTSTAHFLRTGYWNGWEVAEALRALKGGLLIMPSASIICTTYEYGRFRGWSERFNILVVTFLGVVLFLSMWYLKKRG